jgi:organic hydroperoxide reductase OsmC/OhrA
MNGCHEEAAPLPFTELVWDTDGLGIAQAGEVSFTTGDAAAWTPELLLATAVGASLMGRFFALARRAGLNVLAYASQQHSTATSSPELTISPCITVRSSDDAVLARALCDHAFAGSPIVAALACPVRVEPHIVALPAEPVDCSC